MWSIDFFEDDREGIKLSTPNILEFWKDKSALFAVGYRLYTVDGEDITEDAKALCENTELVLMRPAGDPVSIVIGVVAAVAATVVMQALVPDIKPPSTSSRSQTSSTNSLGSRDNENGLGQRVDDIWGKVGKHAPKLIQRPRFRYIDDAQTEEFALAVGAGKYQFGNVYDGITDFSRLNGGQFNAWNPGLDPNVATPSFEIGGEIENAFRNVEQSNEVQAAELVPPNDLEIGGSPAWYVSSQSGGDVGILTLTNAEELEIDLTEYYQVGGSITLANAYGADADQNIQLYNTNVPDVTVGMFNTYNLSGAYIITGVTSDTVTIDATPVAAWDDIVYSPLRTSYYLYNNGLNADEDHNGWYYDEAETQLATTTLVTQDLLVQASFSGALGPYFVNDCDNISFNLSARNGFYKLYKNAEQTVTVNVEVVIDELDVDGDPTGNQTAYSFPFSSNSSNLTQPTGKTYDITPPYASQQITFLRTTNRDKSDNTSNVDKVELAELYFESNIGAVTYEDVTVARVSIPYSISASQVKKRIVNMDVTRLITPYVGNGSFGAESAVEDVAEVVIALCLDKYNGRLTLDDIDADLFLSVQDQLKEYYQSDDFVKVGFDLDSTKIKFQEAFNIFWNAVNCKTYTQNSVYKCFPDIKRTVSSKQFTHRYKIPGTDQRTRAYSNNQEYDGVELNYRDNGTGNFETIILHVNGVDSYSRKEMELSAATQYVTALRRAYRELNLLKYQKVSYEFEADGIGNLTVTGERVDNVDHTRIVSREGATTSYKIYDGYVKSYDSVNLITELSQPVFFEDGETYSIRFTDSQGGLMSAVTCTKGSTDYHVVLAEEPDSSVYTGYRKEKTNFTFASDNDRALLPVIVMNTEASESDGLKTRKLSCVNWDERYYQNDLETQ